MPNFSPEISNLNSFSPPPDFLLKVAWELKERYPIDSLSERKRIMRAYSEGRLEKIPPRVDHKTQYLDAPGESRYLVEKEKFEKGGLSDIYRAWDKRMGRYVAVKKLNKEYSIYDNIKQFLELEAKTIARLKHPGIPEVYDFSIATTPDGVSSPLMIMELLKDENIMSRLDNKEKPLLTIEEISRIISQTADTIDYMNKRGLVHGDIKPGNIILSSPYVKVIDFAATNWADKSRQTINPGFSPMEIYRKIKDDRSDEFSLAATAYNIIFNELPPINFGDISDIEPKTKELLNSKQFKYQLTQINKEKLFNILLKGMAARPDDRYQTSTEFAREFCRVIANPSL